MENLIKALVKARAGFEPLKKDKVNPHFKKKYASLDSVNNAVLPSLCKNDLVVTQVIEPMGDGQAVKTVLWHISGEKIESFLMLPNTGDMQKLGSAITYARRYALSAILGVSADEDDDGNGAGGAPPKSKPGCITDAQKKRLYTIASQNGFDKDSSKELLKSFGFESSGDVTVAKYDEVIKAFEQGVTDEKH